MQYGMGEIQFGMVMLINCALGLNTPPVGTTQFVGCAIGGVSVGTVMRTIWPFYGALIAALMLVTYVPAFSLWLPGLLLKDLIRRPAHDLEIPGGPQALGQPARASARAVVPECGESGLVRVHGRYCVVADDELHLGVFDVGSAAPLRLVRLFEGELPSDPVERKASKPDLEALLVLPASAEAPCAARCWPSARGRAGTGSRAP